MRSHPNTKTMSPTQRHPTGCAAKLSPAGRVTGVDHQQSETA